MLMKALKSIALAIIVIIACFFVALLLSLIHLELTEAIGAFIKTWAPAIGIIAGVWYFVTH